MANISIIVRSYNEELHIGKLLKGIASQDLGNCEVIVVDSGSTDGTVAIAERHGAKIVRIAKSDFSFGRALNRGCEVATGEILVFASAHVYPVRRDWLRELVAPFQDPKVVLSYGRQIGNEVTRFSEHQIFRSWFPDTSVARQPHNFCNNANCAVRRDVWRDNPYDEDLTGLEDLAWAKVVRHQGGQIAYCAAATIVHVHEETWGRVRNRYRREAMALKHIEPTIAFGFWSFVCLTLTNVIVDLVAAKKQSVLLKEAGSILMFRFNQFYGTWRGHKSHRALDSVLRERFYYPAGGRRSSDTNPQLISDRPELLIQYDDHRAI